MGRSILHRWFGAGSLPKRRRPQLESEGIRLVDEGIRGSVTYRNFRAPGRRSHYRKSAFVGSLVITDARFAAYIYSRPIINIPFSTGKLRELNVDVEGMVLCIRFDPAAFHDDWSGSIEVRYDTPRARQIADRIGELCAR